MDCNHCIPQSPIELLPAIPSQLPGLRFHYQDTPLDIRFSGNNFDVNVQPGSYFAFGTQQFQLKSFHFHLPSEHAIDGEFSSMELHLVHQDLTEQFAVVGIMLEEGPPNPLLETIWKNLPSGPGESVQNPTVVINPSQLLPQDRTYTHYKGSLTTPPFDVSVLWYVLHGKQGVSQEMMAQFKKIVGTNARPLQPRQQRKVQRSAK